MEGCLVSTLSHLRSLSHLQIQQSLRRESSRLELTKSLLSVLFNLCLIHSFHIPKRLKKDFAKHTKVVLKLLAGAKKRPNSTLDLASKKRLLHKTPELAALISEACHLARRRFAV